MSVPVTIESVHASGAFSIVCALFSAMASFREFVLCLTRPSIRHYPNTRYRAVPRGTHATTHHLSRFVRSHWVGRAPWVRLLDYEFLGIGRWVRFGRVASFLDFRLAWWVRFARSDRLAGFVRPLFSFLMPMAHPPSHALCRKSDDRDSDLMDRRPGRAVEVSSGVISVGSAWLLAGQEAKSGVRKHLSGWMVLTSYLL